MTNRIPLIVNPGAAQIQEISSTDVLAVPGTVTANAVQTDNYQYANGQPFSGGGGGSYGDSNVVTLLGDFGSNSVSTTGSVTAGQFDVGANLYIGPGPGGGTFVLANVDTSLVTLSQGANGAAFVGWQEVLFGPGGNIATINFNPDGNGQGNMVVSTGPTSSQYTWTFDNTGNLTAPGNIKANAITLKNTDDFAQIVFSSDGGATNNGQIKVDGGTNMTINAASNFYVKQSGQDRLAITNTTSDLMASTNVRIQSNKTGSAYTWTFDTDGNLIVPPSSVISPASGTVGLATTDGNTYAYADASGFYIDTLYNTAEYEWHFDNTGNLTLPSTTSNINYANGISILNDIATTGNFAFDTADLDGTAFDEVALTGTNSGNILINADGLVAVLGAYESDGMVAGTGNVYLFNGDPTFVDGIPQPGVGKIWQFGNDGELYLPTGGSLGPVGKGWTGLGGGNGNPLSLTSYYSDGMYSSCINLNTDGTLYIATYGDGTGQQGNWNFSNTNLTVTGNSTIAIANANSGLGGGSLTIQAGASDVNTFNGNPGGDLNIIGGYGSFGDGGGGPGGNVNITGGGSSDSTPGNVNINSGSNINIKTYMGGGLAGVWTFDNTGALTVAGNINGDGASPAPSINGFSSINAITLSASGNVYGTNFIGNVAGNLVSGANSAGFDPYGDFVLPSSVYVGHGANMGLAISTNSTGATIAAPQTGQNLIFQTNSVGPVYHNLVFDQLGNLSAPGNISVAGTVTANVFVGDGGLLSNIQVSGGSPVSTTGNVSGGNLIATGTVSASGNITANYFFGNGSQLTGIVATEPSFSIQSSNFPASAGNRYGVNTTGATITATLPASPGTGDAVFFADAGGAFATNNLIVNPNGRSIMGASGNMTVSTNNQSFGLFYNGTTWRTYNAG